MKNEKRRPCPACESTYASFCGAKNGFDIFVCRECETIYTSRLPSSDEGENYDEYYTDANLTVPVFIIGRVSEIVSGFAKFRKTNRLLDIGFGSGILLTEAKNQEWDALGTEVSRPAIEHAREKGHEVFHGVLSDAEFPDDFFDVVAASEILEHLPDPQSELLEIARILRPGGLLWATTPSAKSLSFSLMKHNWSVVAPPDHTQLYSKKGAHLMLNTAGFSKIKMQTLGLNLMEIMNYYRPRTDVDRSFDRVSSSYQLNEQMTRSPLRRGIKGLLNNVLDKLQLGDSLKIHAHKSRSKYSD